MRGWIDEFVCCVPWGSERAEDEEESEHCMGIPRIPFLPSKTTLALLILPSAASQHTRPTTIAVSCFGTPTGVNSIPPSPSPRSTRSLCKRSKAFSWARARSSSVVYMYRYRVGRLIFRAPGRVPEERRAGGGGREEEGGQGGVREEVEGKRGRERGAKEAHT